MFKQTVVSCLAVASTIALGVVAPRQADAQSGATPPATAANPFAVPPSVKRVSISKAVFGDAGVMVNARDDGFIELAAAGPQKPVYLQLRIAAARVWVDSTARMMKAIVKKNEPPRTYRSDVQEYGTTSRMAMTRSVNAGASEFSLGFSENTENAFTVPIEAEEADVFVAILRKAIAASAKMLDKSDTTAVRSDSAAKADSIAAAKKKKSAAKRAAPPPVKDSSAKKDTTTKAPATKTPVRPATTKPSPA